MKNKLSNGLRLILALVGILTLGVPNIYAAGNTDTALPYSSAGPICTVDDDGGADYTTIQDAVNDTACATLDIGAGNYTENVVITRNLTLTGAGPTMTSVGWTGRAFYIGDASHTDIHVSISGMDIAGIYDDYGTGIYNWGTLTLTNVLVWYSEATYDGGGIFTRGDLTVLNSSVVGNTAGNMGGGISSWTGATVTIRDSIIQENYAHGGGGGIYNPNDTHNPTNSGRLTIDNTHIITNSAGSHLGYGGGIDNRGWLTLTNSTVQGNTADYYGGGLFVGYAGSAVIEDCTITANKAGSLGGGVCGSDLSSTGAESALTIARSTISDNSAQFGGGIQSTGHLEIVESLIADNSAGSGGGISSSDDLTITASTLSGNTGTLWGGGINHSDGGLTLTNVTVSGNSTEGDGGGVRISGGSALLDSVTIANNTADTDGVSGGDGGGLYGSAVVKNSIIAGNSDPSTVGPVEPDCSGAFTTGGYNVIGDITGCSGLVSVYDQYGTSSDPLEAHLQPLGDYGGPTPTHALKYSRTAKSPAVDTGSPDCPSTDQRGWSRPVDGDGDGNAACDSGAYEYGSAELPPDLALVKTVTPDFADPGESITYTLVFSNTGNQTATGVLITDTIPISVTNTGFIASGAVVTQTPSTRYVWQIEDLEPGVVGIITVTGVLSDDLAGSIVANTAAIATDADANLTNNAGSASVNVAMCFATPDNGATVYQSADAQAVREALNAASVDGVVKVAGTCAGVDSYGRVALISQNVTLRGGYTKDNWAVADPDNPATLDAEDGEHVVYITNSDVTLRNLRITGGATTNRGGGIYAKSSAVVLNAVSVFGNNADNYGGGIYVEQGSLTLYETDVFSNTADWGGGIGIIDNDTTLSVNRGDIYGNNAGSSGGGLYFTGSSAALTQTHILSNTVPDYGGGVYVYSTTVTMSDGLVVSNTGKYGGGMYISSSDVTWDAMSITNNTAAYGGAIYARIVTLTASETFIDSNHATTNGGGIYASDSDITLSETRLFDNKADGSGGGGYLYAGNAALERSAVISNTALNGGGLYIGYGALELINVTLGQNVASLNGGGIYAKSETTTALTFTTVVDNQGGGIYHATDATVTAQNSLLASNDTYNCDTSITSNGYNLESDDTCGLTATGDQQNASPLLIALADNGGDTLTYALQPGSPAIDTGLCIPGITTDQRGAPRPGPGSIACDVGAYESTTPSPPDVTIAKTVTPSSAAPGDLITYTLTFTNASSVVATGVVITDIVPVQIDVAGFENLSGWTVTREPGTWYVWRVQNLDPGASGSLIITGTLRLPLTAGHFANTAEITARRDDDSGNNSSVVQTTVLNVAPTAHDATFPPVDEDYSPIVSISASDDNDDILTYAVLVNPSVGTIASIGTNRFIYTPTNQTANYTDTFTCIVTDTGGLTDTAVVTIPVAANDDPPFISNIPNQRTDPGVTVGPIPFTVDDIDTPIGALTLGRTTSNPAIAPLANITVGGSGANRTVIITPTMNTGTALITVTVSDGHASRRDVFALTVGAAVNSPPEFTSTPVTEATQDAVYTYAITAADLDAGDALTIAALLEPAWLALTDHGDGTATLTGTPRNANVGDHAVTLRVVDNAGALGTQAFTVTVANVNDAPVAQDDVASTNEITPKPIPVLSNDDNDPDGDTVFLVAVGTPLYGSASVSGSVVVYTPTNRTATYADPFTYTISDGALTDTGNVTVTVSAVDDPPTISDIANRQTRQGVTTGPINFTVGDPDTPLAALTLTRASSNLALVPLSNITFGGSGNLRTVTVTPTAALYGLAVITITVGDGHASTADSFVLDVIANNAPVFVTEPITEASEDIEYTYAILTADADGDALDIIAPVRPAWLHFVDHGDGNAVLSGLPLASDVGEHPVTLHVVDSFGALATQAFTVTVADVNDPPLARNDVAATNEHTPRVIPVLANDSDPDSDLFVAEVTTPLYGSAVISGGAVGSDVVIYTPLNRTASYTDTFVYIVSDGVLEDSAAVVVAVTAADDPPFISNILNQHTDTGVPLTVPFVVNDPDTPLDTLILDKASSDEGLVPTANITFGGSGLNRTVTLTPTGGLSGTVIITLTANDGTTPAADSFTLAVAVDSPPEFTSAPLTEATEGVFYVYHIIAVDVETNVLTITAPVSPTWLTLYDYHNGRATLVGKPLNEDVGDHSVTLHVEDDAGSSDMQDFVITVHDALHAPHAVDDTAATDEDTPVSVAVLDNDDDLDDDPLTLIAWGQPQSGVSSCDTLLATCTYTPANRLSDYTVAFTYTISDGGLTDAATVRVDVTADDDPPGITTIDDQSTDAGVPVGPLPFTVGDPDTPIPALLLDKTSSNTTLVPVENIALGGEGMLRSVTVTPTVMSGTATITISVSDGTSTAHEAFVLTVGTSPVNRPPVADAGPDQIVAPSAAVTLNGSASTDPDGDALVYFWQQTGGLPVSLIATGIVSPTFTAPSSAGVLTFTLTITDTGGLADSDEVVVRVADYFVFLPLVIRNN